MVLQPFYQDYQDPVVEKADVREIKFTIIDLPEV